MTINEALGACIYVSIMKHLAQCREVISVNLLWVWEVGMSTTYTCGGLDTVRNRTICRSSRRKTMEGVSRVNSKESLTETIYCFNYVYILLNSGAESTLLVTPVP